MFYKKLKSIISQKAGRLAALMLIASLAAGNCVPEDPNADDETASYSIGGNVSGLIGTVVLTNNGGDDLTITADGSFTFATQVADGGEYNVQVKTNPAGQTCTPASNTGTMAGAAVSDVTVTCSTDPTYSVGVTVTGLNGTLVLQNNGGDDKTITADGSYSFATTLANDAGYAVTILSSPGVESCSVTGGTGTISDENATGITVNCYTQLFFAGRTDNTNLILYKSDGTEAGTVPVKSGFTNMSYGPESFVFLNGKVYFRAEDGLNYGLWESDGTADGTKPLKLFSQTPYSFAVLNGKLYFNAGDDVNGSELWESDGTEAGTKLVKDINSGTNGSNIWGFAVMNSKLYFSAFDGVNGRELWESDGTADGTKLVKDINGGAVGSDPSNFAVLNSKLYFSAVDSVNGRELWESDGT
jgi:ELWxxDGT repeat protein